MAKITVEEPKSVVEEVEKFKCEECGAIVDEDEINTARLYAGDDGQFVGSKHLCNTCNGARHALNVREDEERLKARWEGFRGWIDPTILTGAFLLGCGLTAGLLRAMGIVQTKTGYGPAEWTFQGILGIVAWVLFSLILLFGVLLIVPEPE